ncbi:DUF1826 domain-containing protein [Marinobacter sp. NP-4(2019)]|uniref:DUF1826 domain-containing protein n=1 Tax=Marinobacter sp. NP-4(2019) TaxID=2488665 RepID=UPI001D18FCB5|nr:DUF1826 domain-containing protein [Marinobacter sp. NP-4(2019)]
MAHKPAALGKPIAVIGDQPECLTEIFRDEINLAVWNRSLQPRVTRFAGSIGGSQ